MPLKTLAFFLVLWTQILYAAEKKDIPTWKAYDELLEGWFASELYLNCGTHSLFKIAKSFGGKVNLFKLVSNKGWVKFDDLEIDGFVLRFQFQKGLPLKVSSFEEAFSLRYNFTRYLREQYRATLTDKWLTDEEFEKYFNIKGSYKEHKYLNMQHAFYGSKAEVSVSSDVRVVDRDGYTYLDANRTWWLDDVPKTLVQFVETCEISN